MPYLAPKGTYSVVETNINNKKVIPTDGLICFLKFDNNYTDETKLCSFGLTTGTVQYSNGVFDQSAYFDGNTYIQTQDLKVNDYNALSFSFWMAYDGTEGKIFGFSGDLDMAVQIVSEGTGRIYFRGCLNYSNIPSYFVNDNQFHYYVIIVDNTGTKLYRDNTLIATIGQTKCDVSELFTVGNVVDNNGNSEYFKGYLDQLRIYNRALSEDEINTLYNEKTAFDGYPALQGENQENGNYKLSLNIQYPEITGKLNPQYPTNGLIACYDFEGNANDNCGNYNGSWVGNEQYDTGVVGKAAKFNGNNKINVGNLDCDNEVWISLWIKCDETAVNKMICGFYDYDLYLYDKYIGWNTASSDVFGVEFPSNLYNKWVHLVFNFKQNSYGDTLYINGVKQNLSQIKNSINTSNANINNAFYIGGWGENEYYNFIGLIDQVKIYNRALTESEILQLYNEPNTNKIGNLPKDYLAYYPLDGNVNDINGNNGTVAGSITFEEGVKNQCAHLTTSSYFYIPKLITNTDAFTISLWVKDLVQGSNYGAIVFDYAQDYWYMFYQNNSITFVIRNSNSNTYKINKDIDVSEWNMITMSHDPNIGSLKAYINGELIEEVSTGTGERTTETNYGNGIYFGQNPSELNSSAYSLQDGLLDEIYLFNRQLLDDEVYKLYNPDPNNYTIGKDCNLDKVLHIVFGNMTDNGKLLINGNEVNKDIV